MRRMSVARWDVLDSLRTLGDATARQIAEHTGRDRRNVASLLALAEDDALVWRVGVEPLGDAPIWRLGTAAEIPLEPPAKLELDKRPGLTYRRLADHAPDWWRAYDHEETAYIAARRYAQRGGHPWPPTGAR